MEFYSALAEHYDEIFPLDPGATDFVLSSLALGRPAAIIDVGCATGGLAFALAAKGHRVIGIDTDEIMIAIARSRAVQAARTGSIVFQTDDMRFIGRVFMPKRFDCIICLGNTLVHLASEAEIGGFLKQARDLLTPAGALLIQILNYDYILDRNITVLPAIKTSRFIFQRRYAARPDGRLDFNAELVNTENGISLNNTIPLVPLRKGALDRLLNDAGFDYCEYYSGFQREAFIADGMLLVVRAAL